MQLTSFDAPSVRSLQWCGDQLVDWVAGGSVYSTAGEVARAGVSYAYSFDAAVTSPSGEFVALYTRRGTKGLLLRHGEVVREFNRSYYQANVYDFPIEFVTLSDGREAIAHCPADYNRLEFEIAASGEIVTADAKRKPDDYFFSRLRTSPNGRYLASGGWVWHPLDVHRVYDVHSVEHNSLLLDGSGTELPIWSEESSFVFLSDSELVLAISGWTLDDETEIAGTELRTYLLQDARAQLTRTVRVHEQISLVSRLTGRRVLALGKVPMVIEPSTGEIHEAWNDLTLDSVPRSAVDPPAKNFHIAVNSECDSFALWHRGKIYFGR